MTDIQKAKITPEALRKRKIAMSIFGGSVLIIAVLWLLYWFIFGKYEEYTDDAYVSGNMVQLMPQVPGTVIEINVDDTQLVTEGQVIVRLDASDYKVALQRAKADLARTVREVRQYYEQVAQAQQTLVLDKANLVKAEDDLKRRLGLVGNCAVSRESMQHFKTAVEAAQASYKASSHRLDAALALVENSTLYHHPAVETAKANLKTAYLNVQRTTIVSPIAGYIARRNIQLGQQVSPNSAMLAIIPLHDTWVDANYKESSLVNIRVNQPVTMYADAYPDITYHGTVVGLSAGTGSAFSLLPPQNATGNWIKIVQRLPVRIRFNTDELLKNPLQLGLSMRVTVNTHDRQGHRMSGKDKPVIQYKTDAYAKQLAEIDPVIATILKENSPDVSQPRANV